MSYITKRPEGAPDWIPAAVLCRVRDSRTDKWSTDYIKTFDQTNQRCHFIGEDDNWLEAEPIEAWLPKEGEIVAAWDCDDTRFLITVYKSKAKTVGHFTDGWGGCYDNISPIDHVARLVYPDGRIIDCACDVEELKRRVGEGNWL